MVEVAARGDGPVLPLVCKVEASVELFGLGWRRQMSGQPAEAPAEAAQRFGQGDDITLQAPAFAGVEVAHA